MLGKVAAKQIDAVGTASSHIHVALAQEIALLRDDT